MDPRQTINEPAGASGERRTRDRRVAPDASYAGPERRQQDRRTRD